MFKTETHLHSAGVSRCATVTYDQIIEKYTAAGYSTIVLTNHMVKEYLDRSLPNGGWHDMMEYFVEAYRELKQKASGKLNVILGAELRFTENLNDYLVYGMTENFLLNSENLCEKGLTSFYHIAKENGFLIYQAHPFRKSMVIPDVRYLDGIEVFNGAHGHNSRNPIANAWADYHCLNKLSGTDFHHINSPVTGGIVTENEIKTLDEFMKILKENKYKLIRKPWKRFLGNKPNIHSNDVL